MFKVYSQPNCPTCEQLKEYLKIRQIDFEELNVTQDHSAKAFMIMNDLETTPAVTFNGNVFGGDLDTIKFNIENYAV